MIPIRVWLYIIAGVIVLSLVGGAGWFWKDYKAKEAKIAELESVQAVTSAATDALSQANTSSQEVVVTVRQERATQDAIYEKLKRDNPAVRDWADTPLPDELRNSDGNEVNGLEDSPSGR